MQISMQISIQVDDFSILAFYCLLIIFVKSNNLQFLLLIVK